MKYEPATLCPLCAATAAYRQEVGSFPLLRCGSCNLEFLRPQPDDDVLNRIYGRDYYDAWGVAEAESAVRDLKMATFRTRWQAISRLLPDKPRVLDVGCAMGYFMEVVEETGGQPYGVEISERGVECCRRKFGKDSVHQGELETADFPDMQEQRFDAIFMSDLLEHVRDPSSTLRQARQRLTATGLLVVTAPNTSSSSRKIMGKRWPHYKPEHLYYFNEKNLRQLFQQSGFAAVRFQTVKKSLSARYLINQYLRFGKHPERMQAVTKLLPAGMLDISFSIPTGEITAIAQVIDASNA